MNPAQALADLTEISSQIRAAALIDSEGAVAASTLHDETRAAEFARAASELLAAADSVRAGGESLTQLEVATGDGSVFVLRDGGMTIAATTSPEPTVGLVFYDLKSCLRSVADEGEKAGPEQPEPGSPEAEPPAEPAAEAAEEAQAASVEAEREGETAQTTGENE